MHIAPMTHDLVQKEISDIERPASARRLITIFLIVCVTISSVILWLVGNAAREQAIATLRDQAKSDATISTALVRTVLDKQRAIPFVLSNDHELQAVLENPSPEALQALNVKFADLAKGTGAAVIYLMGLDGVAIVASNWNEPISFVGSSYKFRPYFTQALTDGGYEYFALGNVSNRPGLYISRRIDGKDGPLGVVAVKLEFDHLEADWNAANRPIFVADDSNIVLMSGIPSWRFMTIGQLSADKIQQIHDTRQFGDAPLLPLPITTKETLTDTSFIADVLLPGQTKSATLLAVRSSVPSTAWHTYIFSPVEAFVTTKVRAAQLFTLVILIAVAALAGFLLQRRWKTIVRIAEARRVRRELEERVTDRTADLVKVKDRLQAEVSEHQKTETALREVQQNLVHANRLAILGQVAAGVAHEINQPVATIRAYSDNTRTLIKRENFDAASENLREIAQLTDRIGTITNEMRTFARKAHQPAAPVSLHAIISGALVLLRSRFTGRMDQLHIDFPRKNLLVLGNSIRLEQVLINIFQNALEAVSCRKTGGQVSVSVAEHPESVVVTITDNGHGIPQHIQEHLFTPFNTSKEKGLGLGLVISKEILADYGGSINATSTDEETSFTIELRKA